MSGVRAAIRPMFNTGYVGHRNMIGELQERHRRPRPDRVFRDTILGLDRDSIASVEDPSFPARLIRLDRPGLTYDKGIWPPEHCIPDGVAYGIEVDGSIVSVAYAHRTGVMEDLVADMAVVTTEEHRQKGYGRAVVHAVAKHFVERGGEAWYGHSPGNTASHRTARSVGFIPLGESLILVTKNQGS